MLEIDTGPFFQIGLLQGRWTTVGLMVSFLIVMGIGIIEARRYGKPFNQDVLFLSLLLIIGSLVGGRILAILDNPGALLDQSA